MTQHLVALAEANRIRFHRAKVKSDLQYGLVKLEDVLLDPDCGTMRLNSVLKAKAGWGVARARATANAMDCAEDRQLRHLTDRQRRILLEIAG